MAPRANLTHRLRECCVMLDCVVADRLEPSGIPFEALQAGQCRFILADKARVLYCGKPAMRGGRSWCEEHHLLVYVPRKPAPERPAVAVQRPSDERHILRPRTSRQYSPWGGERDL